MLVKAFIVFIFEAFVGLLTFVTLGRVMKDEDWTGNTIKMIIIVLVMSSISILIGSALDRLLS